MIDSALFNPHLEKEYTKNEPSHLDLSNKKAFTKSLIMDGLVEIDRLIGIEYLFCGVLEENHPAVKKRLHEQLSRICERNRGGYHIESALHKTASNAVIRLGKHGHCFTDELVELATLYKEEQKNDKTN